MTYKMGLASVFAVTVLAVTAGFIPSSQGSLLIKAPMGNRSITHSCLWRARFPGARIRRRALPAYADRLIYSFPDFNESILKAPSSPLEKYTDYGSLSF